MKKVVKYGLIAGILMAVSGMLLSFLFGIIFPSINAVYQDTMIFRAMNDPLMSLFWLYPIVLGFVFSFIWDKTRKLFKQKKVCKKAMSFAWMYFLVAAVPAFLINVSSFNLPILMVLTWTFMSFVNGLVGGLAELAVDLHGFSLNVDGVQR